MRFHTLVAMLALATALRTGSTARAADEPSNSEAEEMTKARTLFEEAERHYQAATYDKAAALYEESYRLAGAPALLFNVAQCRRLMGDCDGALETYRRFLLEAPAGQDRADAEALSARMEACVAERRLAAATSAKPASAPRVPATARPMNAPVVVVAASPATSSPPEGAAAGARRRLGSVLVAGGVASLGAAGYFLYRGHAAASRVEQALAERPRTWDASLRDEDGDGRWSNRAAAVLGVVGTASTVAGAWLWWRALRRESRAQVAVTWMGGPHLVCAAEF